jgi:hypothetical protein
MLQVPLVKVQSAGEGVDNDRCGSATFPRGKAERLLRVTPALGEAPERA